MLPLVVGGSNAKLRCAHVPVRWVIPPAPAQVRDGADESDEVNLGQDGEREQVKGIIAAIRERSRKCKPRSERGTCRMQGLNSLVPC